MTITFEGKPPSIKRKIVGLYSLDRATVGFETPIGLPNNYGYELYGVSGAGKSTFAYSLAGMMSEVGGIVLGDFEGYDPDHLLATLEGVNFDGVVRSVQEKEDEDQLDGILKAVGSDRFDVCILDSIGALSSLAEQTGEIGERNMGRRAQNMAQWSRKAVAICRTKPKVFLMINHMYPLIGSKGWDTPGGNVKKYLAGVRFHLKRKETFNDGSYVLQGNVTKNRWGYINRPFYVVILAGAGIHKGMTAVYDCIVSGLATRKTTVKIGDTSYGRMADLLKAARRGNDDIFVPFQEALAGGTEFVVKEEPDEDADLEEEVED